MDGQAWFGFKTGYSCAMVAFGTPCPPGLLGYIGSLNYNVPGYGMPAVGAQDPKPAQDIVAIDRPSYLHLALCSLTNR